jgi:hypothetical protein
MPSQRPPKIILLIIFVFIDLLLKKKDLLSAAEGNIGFDIFKNSVRLNVSKGSLGNQNSLVDILENIVILYKHTILDFLGSF